MQAVTKTLTLTLMISLLAACAGRPIVDMAGVDPAQYQRDLAECRGYADQVPKRAGGGAVVGALIGAAVGAAIGNSDTAQALAGAGAVQGAAEGAAMSHQERAVVVRRCLAGRGYRVLN